jgi:lipid A 3-O-deacylase
LKPENIPAFFMLKYAKPLFTLTLVLLGINGFCQQKTYKNELGFKSENDSFLATSQDRYYTNGLFINFRGALKSDTLNFRKKIFSVSVGQELYNAQTGAVPNSSYVDRPFAAYLFGGVSMQYFDKKENNTKLSIEVGTIGPNALGKQTQELIHSTFGFYNPNGWQFQVNNEIGLNFNLQSHVFLYRSKNKKIDLSIPLEARIGNTYSGLKYGVLFRTGKLNPFYHSVATQSNITTSQESGLNKKEFYFFLKPAVDLVLYNATIKGGLFLKDKGLVTFQSKPVVFSQQLGLAFANQRWTFDFSVIFKSKELKQMEKSNQYGSLDIYYRF